MFTLHLVAYTAATPTGTVSGVARVGTRGATPTWTECADQIPVTGLLSVEYLETEPTYTLRYSLPSGDCVKHVGAVDIARLGSILTRCPEDRVWDIQVLDAAGDDVTFDFAVFAR
jgi:hypothetical protein